MYVYQGVVGYFTGVATVVGVYQGVGFVMVIMTAVT